MSGSGNRQRGAALIAMLAIVILAASWMLVSRISGSSGDILAAKRARNAVVLNQAKQAIVGWVALQATKAGEDNPGRLPCPEHPWYIGNAAKEGLSGPSTGVSNPGVGALNSNCTTFGRFPWRSVGTDKLVDSSGEPLWLIVGPTWRVTSTSSKLTINSNSIGDIGVDGQQVVALIIAPGPAMNAAASTGCTARNQARNAPSPAMDPADYLECFNAATLQFTATAPGTSLNDQMVKITAADVMPVIEAAIANRIEREIVPALKSVYAPPDWGLSGNPVYPFAAPFGNPGPGAGTSSFQGAAGTYQGLLPVNYTNGCNPATDPRCNTSFVAWNLTPTLQKIGGTADLDNASCSSITTPVTTAQCFGQYKNSGTLQVRMITRARNVAMALRQLDPTQAIAECRLSTSAPWASCGATTTSATGTLDSSGAGTISVNVTLPNRSDEPFIRITMNIGVLADHALIDRSDSAIGWFVRNEWYRLAYYAVAPGYTATVLPAARSCTTGGTCLSVANGDPARTITPVGGQRALLILAGRSINGSTRPSGAIGDYFEFGNASGAFERQVVSTTDNASLKRPFNDRVVVVDKN